MWTMFPLITEPFWVMWLETITSIVPVRVFGGAELFPVRVVQTDPQDIAFGLSAKPFMDAGARPPLSLFIFHHWAPQKYWVDVVAAERFPTTNAPTALGANTVTFAEAVAGRNHVSPAKLALTATVPIGWFTGVTLHLATPVAFVVPVHDCAPRPDPSVKVTVFVPSAVPAAGSSVVSFPDSVIALPFTTEVVPV